LFADSVYNGPNLQAALTKFGSWTIEIVKCAADPIGFELLSRLRLAQSQPPPGKRFRSIDCQLQGMGLYRLAAAPHQEIGLTFTQSIYDIIQPFRLSLRH
jgi:hypothetical protein